MKPKLIHLDELANTCGYFTSDTIVNNAYGCNHPNFEDSELVKLNDPYTYADSQKVRLALLRKKYGSWGQIMEAEKEAVKWVREAEFDDELLKEIGVRKQGKCYGFSCPLAYECDLADLKEHDTNLYNEYKDEELGPEGVGADWLIQYTEAKDD